jgi:glucose/arabinose dehydrogenase
MNKIVFASALALTLAASGTAFAQPATGVANPAPPVAAKPQKAEKSALTIDKFRQDLQKAGFSEVKVLEDAFLVQAETKDGSPILMTFGPNGISALEVSAPNTQVLAKGANANLTFDTRRRITIGFAKSSPRNPRE